MGHDLPIFCYWLRIWQIRRNHCAVVQRPKILTGIMTLSDTIRFLPYMTVWSNERSSSYNKPQKPTIRDLHGLLRGFYSVIQCRVRLFVLVCMFSRPASTLAVLHTRSLVYLGFSDYAHSLAALSVRFPSSLLMMLKQTYWLLSAQTFDDTFMVHDWLMIAKFPIPRST